MRVLPLDCVDVQSAGGSLHTPKDLYNEHNRGGGMRGDGQLSSDSRNGFRQRMHVGTIAPRHARLGEECAGELHSEPFTPNTPIVSKKHVPAGTPASRAFSGVKLLYLT